MSIKRLDPRITIYEFLSEFVKGRSVLDVGCVDHTAKTEVTDFWLHKHLARSASSALGIDILESDVELLRRQGYNMMCADGMTVSLGQTFDVVVLGEIIEHVVNPGALLSNMRRHLNKDGRLVLTTPHPFSFLNTLVPLFSWQQRLWHPDHVAWYCPWTVEGMLRKTGYSIEECYYFTRSRTLRRILRTLHIPVFGVLAMSFMVIAKAIPSET